MINGQFSVLFCCLTIICLTNADPVSFITKCKGADSKCIKESTKAALPFFSDGIPELGIDPIDPFVVSKADASSQNLKLLITDFTVKGIRGCIIKKMQRDVEKSKLLVKILCNINLDGDYEMNGRLLILPMEGKGKINVVLRKILISVEVDLGENVKDDKKYWTIKNWKHSYELKDKADVVFENLFNGNEILGRAARELVASSGNDIVLEVGPPVVKTVLAHIIKTIQKFFQRVPLDDLVLD